MQIRPITAKDREAIIAQEGPIVVSRGHVHELSLLPGDGCRIDEELVGWIFYAINGDECEIVSLESRVENRGVGTRLIESLTEKAGAAGCRRIWLITSNDNIRAIRFYQKRGFDLAAVHRDAIAEARKRKPSIPLIGCEGIPVRHELEFELRLVPQPEPGL